MHLQEKDLVDFCQFHGIQLQAYSPLGSSPEFYTALFTPKYKILEHPVHRPGLYGGNCDF